MAAAPAARQRAGPRPEVLARAARRCSAARTADRSRAASAPDVPRRDLSGEHRRRPRESPVRAWARRGSHPVHDAPRRVRRPAAPVHGAARDLRRHASRRANAPGARRPHRLLREHARAAHRGPRRRVLCRCVDTRAGDGALRLRARAPAVREAGGGQATGARSEPQSAVPGDVQPPDGHRRRAGRCRMARHAHAGRRRPHRAWNGEVRSGSVPRGVADRHSRLRGICDGPVRPHDDRAADLALPDLAGRGERQSAAADLELAADVGRRARAAAAGIERRVRPLETGGRQPHAPSLVRDHRGAAPGSTAVVSGEQRVSYGELGARADAVARTLRRLGVGPETRVGLCVSRSVDLIVGVLAILKAGGAYLPLDPEYPTERLALMTDEAQVPVILSQRVLVDKLPPTSARVLFLDDAETWPDASTDAPMPEVCGDNAAYVIYTSGSTGRPKGVMVTHENVVRLLDQTESWFHFDERDVWTLFHSYAFDFSVWEIWGALAYGGRLVIVPYDVSRWPDAFLKLLAAERVTVLNQTPSAFSSLVREEESEDTRNLDLRLVIFGGEALDLPRLKPWVDRHGDERPQLVNMYGITETTVH